MKEHFNKKYNTYNLDGDYGIGYTNNNQEFYFDLEDYDKIKSYCWFKSGRGYIESNMINKQGARILIKLHRFVMNVETREIIIDHINRNKVDCRKQNLRKYNQNKNSKNTSLSKNNTSGIIGVSWEKSRQKWKAQIKVNYKAMSLGRYDDKEEAIKARLEAEQKYFGEFSPQKHLFSEYGLE